MRRWRATFLLGLAFGILSVALWCASMLWYVRTADVLNGTARGDIAFGYGGVRVEYYEKPISWIAFKHGIEWQPTRPRLLPNARSNANTISVFVPLWMPGVVCFGVAGWARWRLARRLIGRCRTCGYDIRAVSGNICPECGKSVPIKPALANQRATGG